MLEQFKKKIQQKKARIGIVGLGYVGLPLAVLFAKKGFKVEGIDLDATKVSRLNRGQSYVLDISSKDLKKVVRSGNLRASADYRNAGSLDAVIICVPTPLNKTKEPDISHVIKVTESLSKYLHKGQLIVLESTTYPGTTEEIMLPLLEKTGLSAKKDFFLAFSPERIDPGNKNFSTEDIPKVVGGFGLESTAAAGALYGAVMKKIVPVSSTRTAEMAKLLENTFRSVNIGLINEMALLCHKFGVDIWEVIEAAKTKPFGFMPFYPGPGIGGHCLPIDPLYLSWKSRKHHFRAEIIELAARVNHSMPERVVERIREILKSSGKPLKKARVLVLGAAYKRDIDDARESPAIDVMAHLIKQGAVVSYSDPFVKTVMAGSSRLASTKLSQAMIQRQDCVVILTDHSGFDYLSVVKHSEVILDTRNVLRKFAPKTNLFFI